ncbi:hypothetical protein QQX98_007052 [Neonectria punicea]|uniref:Vacuolar protein sorting-associated protein 54 C-terminal domain-containing protein n=1 Tax=Neonectria punicea TaxID=979145 RepID=A0ABR1GZQ8_9HYPO
MLNSGARQPHAAAQASGAHKHLTARDIPPVTLTNIAHVDTAEFKPYLVQLGAFYERLRRLEASEEEAAATLPKTSGPPPLTTIPAVYFDANFHLENPRTFDVVTERSEVVRRLDETKVPANASARAPRKALATNAILQEKLSWYIDTAEMHLIASISAAATSFFAALGSLRELHAEAASSVERIKALRRELDVLDQETAINGLHIVQKRQRWGNLQRLQDAILQLKHIVDSVAACESLVDNGDVDEASEGIASLEKLISGEPGFSKTPCRADGQNVQLRDLRGAAALQGVHDDLATLRFRIGKAYETRCLSLLVGDLRRHSEAVSTQEVLVRWTGAFVRPRGAYTQEHPVLPSYLSLTGGLRSELLETLTGLHRAKHLTIAAAAYREAALKEIRNLVRRSLPSADDEDSESMVSSSTMIGGTRLSQQQKSSILARNLRALEPGDAEAMLIEIYVSVTETLRRLTTQVKLLLDVASSLDYDSSIVARQTQELHKAIDLPRLLGEAVDIAQDRIVKLLRVRSEQSTRLSRAWFLRYFSLNLGFVGEQVFVLPSSAILCTNGLSHFLQLISGMPSMAADISTSLVSYLRHFNACCTRLVLDAGARQSAGLKNITSKHLALASQALAFIATLTGHVGEFVRRHAGRGATTLRVVEFDEVKHICQEQQSRMYDKMVEIMSRLAGSHVKALKGIDWDQGQKDAHAYMATLAKDTTSLHGTLTKTMPKETVCMVMVAVFLSYKVQFGQAFQEIGPMTELGRDSMLLDVEFFKSNLGTIEGFGDAGEYLTALVKAKDVEIAALDAPAAAADTERTDTEKR